MKVLLAIDDEHFGGAIADFVMHHTWPAGTEFKVMNVVPSILAYTSMAAFPDLVREVRQESRMRGEVLVHKIALQLRDVFHSDTTAEAVVEGQPKEEILSMAKEWQSDLILVGSHGRRGISRFVLGSVSMAVASHAHCSVLVVRLTQVELESGKEKEKQASASS